MPNLAATLGGWSARHRLAAIGGWVALVALTMLIGSALGQVTMTQAEYGRGESGRAVWLLADAGIKDPAIEFVMISDPAAGRAAGAGELRAAPSAVHGVVTSAAVIMVAVFAVFGTLSLQQFKQLSVGLSIAVRLDATVVRGVLLPSVMAMLGGRNWYLPRWLSRVLVRGDGG